MKALRYLTDSGLVEFTGYLERARVDGSLGSPFQLLWDDETSHQIDPAVEIDADRLFPDRLALANYLAPLVQQVDHPGIDAWSGLWSWIALLYFDQICPAINGTRKVGEEFRYSLNKGSSVYNFQRASRHLIFSPTWIRILHGGHSPQCMLSQPVSIHPDIGEQLTSINSLVAVSSVMEAADLLYFDVGRGSPKRGATDRNREGTARRFMAVCSQLDLTYDLAQLEAPELIALLPAEFSRWTRSE